MTDGVNIDWSLAGRAPDFAGSYANAFQRGRTIAGQNIAGNAMQGPAQLAGRPPPQNAMSLAPAAPAAGPGGLGDGGIRAQAARRADLLHGLASGLLQKPYAERGAILSHMGPALVAQGVPSAALIGFDPSDKALNEVQNAAAQALSRLNAGDNL